MIAQGEGTRVVVLEQVSLCVSDGNVVALDAQVACRAYIGIGTPWCMHRDMPVRQTDGVVDGDILMAGGQTTFEVAILAALLASALGVIYGAIAGYVGGALDAAMMRFVDMVLSIPVLVLLIFLAASLPSLISSCARDTA